MANDPNFLVNLGDMLDVVFANRESRSGSVDGLSSNLDAVSADEQGARHCVGEPEPALPADFCARCGGYGTRGGAEWIPAMTFTDHRTGEQHTSKAGYGFVSRLCRACNGTGQRINGKRKLRRLQRLAAAVRGAQ